MEEMLDIYDKNLKKIGCQPRSTVHQKGLLHAVTHLWVTDLKEGKIFYQRRSLDKDSFPGYYDTTSAGHIDPHETPSQSMIREAKEEIGLNLSYEQLILLGVVIEHLGNDHEISYIYTTDIHHPAFHPGPEVTEMVSLGINQFLDDNQENYIFMDAEKQPVKISKKQICPHDLSLIKDYLRHIGKVSD